MSFYNFIQHIYLKRFLILFKVLKIFRNQNFTIMTSTLSIDVFSRYKFHFVIGTDAYDT